MSRWWQFLITSSKVLPGKTEDKHAKQENPAKTTDPFLLCKWRQLTVAEPDGIHMLHARFLGFRGCLQAGSSVRWVA